MKLSLFPSQMCSTGAAVRAASFATFLSRCLVAAAILFAGPATAALTVTPITWDVVGLDHNRPLTEGPELFPVGARVCTDADTTDPIVVDHVWDDPDDTWIANRSGSLTSLTFDPLLAGECVDAYFELQLTRGAGAFGQTRPYLIVATTDGGAVSAQTPTPRQIYVERLVSQNRNTTTQIRWGQDPLQSDWQILGGGAGLNLLVGETYFIELTTQTATAYEQIESFLTLSNTIFQVKSVETTYSVKTALDSRIPVPNPSLYGDGCLWEPDPGSPNYLSCLAAGKAGGVIVTTYEIDIITGGGDSVGLEALIYDLSGGSFHYNTDFSRSPGEALIFDSTDATFAKRFIPDTIGADGTARLRLTIGNPNPVAVGGYRFTDNLPGDMVVANPANASTSCGGTLTTTPGSGVIDFDGGIIDANSSCTILVDVTVPFDLGATYPLELLNSVDLFVGDAEDPSDTAEATLIVTEEPPPPVACTELPPGTEVARWDSFNNALAPAPTFQFAPGVAAAQAGTGLTFEVSNDTLEWRATAQVANQTLAQARSTNAYYEFRLDTTGLDSVDLRFVVFRQNNNAPQTVTLDYGPAGNLVESITLDPVPNQPGAPAVRNFIANGLTNLNPNGETLFRVNAYQASGTAQPIRTLQVLMLAEGEICSPVPPGDELDPPVLSKQFNPDSVFPGQVSTLTFTIENPNPADSLSSITFRDEFPAGMQAVSGTFVNNCSAGSNWGLEGVDPSVVLFSDGMLAGGAICTLEVDVFSTAVGANVNVSDPIDALESFPGNSAVDTLEVLPPPLAPSIDKFFDPNPLLDPDGSTTLVFQITNNDPLLDVESVAFNDVLPMVGAAQMQPVDDPLIFVDNGNCGPAFSFTWNGVDTLTLANGEILAGQVCEIAVEVEVPGLDLDPDTGDLPAQFPNQTSTVSHVFEGITYEGNDAEATLLVDQPIPGVRILKQVSADSDPDGAWSNYLAIPLGNDVFYKLTIENIGETVLTDISVTDPDVDTSACPWELDPGFELPVADVSDPEAHIAVCIVGPVTADPAGVVTNFATVEAEGNGTPVEDTDSAIYATAELTLIKSADRQLFDAAGETIDYTFTVENTGDAILVGPVQIDDDLIPDVTCPDLNTIGNLDNFFDPGEILVCTGSYVTDSDDVAAGSVVNVAFAFTPEAVSDIDDAIVELANPALIVSKALTGQSADPIVEGTELTYTITATNTGNVALNNVVVSDLLLTPDTENCASVAVSGTCVLVGSYTVTAADVTTGSISNTGTADSDETDPVEDTLVTPVEASPALIVSKALTGQSADPIVEGTELTFTITATNTGNVALTNVVVSDPILDPSSETCTSVAVSGTCVLVGSYTVTAADVTTGSISNTGTADSDDTDPVEDTLETPVEGSPALIVSKALTGQSADPIVEGTELTYTITATNTGNVTLNNVVVSDLLLTPDTENCASVAVSGTCVLTGTYTVTQADVTAGSVSNTGTADSDETDPVEDTLVTPVEGSPALTASKTSDPATGSFVERGQDINYTVSVVITGGPLTTDLVLTDTLGPGLAFGEVTSIGDFAANTADNPLEFTLASGTVPGTYVVEYTATVDADAVTSVGNAVAVTGNGGDPEPECASCATSHPLSVPPVEPPPTAPIAVNALSRTGLLLLIMLALIAGFRGIAWRRV